MSPRAAWRLESLGFGEVYDYGPSKMDWIGAGLPFDGTLSKEPLLAKLADAEVPTCRMSERVGEVRGRIGKWDICVVVNEVEVVLGLVRAEALGVADDRAVLEMMQEGPSTYRPHVTAQEMVSQLEKSPRSWILVTNLDGTLVGVVRPEQVTEAVESGDGG